MNRDSSSDRHLVLNRRIRDVQTELAEWVQVSRRCWVRRIKQWNEHLPR